MPPASALLDQAVRAAQDSTVTVAFVGLPPDLEGEALQLEPKGFDGGDRTYLELPHAQRMLLERLKTLHKPIVIVLTSGSAVALDPEDVRASAMLAAWYPELSTCSQEGQSIGKTSGHVLSIRGRSAGILRLQLFARGLL